MACMSHLAETDGNPCATDMDGETSELGGSQLSATGQNNGNGHSSGYYHMLVNELACHPETYFAISDLMSGVLRPSPSIDRPPSPSSPTNANSESNTNEITFTNVQSSDVNRFRAVPEDGYNAEAPMQLDRDITGYLNMGADRRLARKELKLEKKKKKEQAASASAFS